MPGKTARRVRVSLVDGGRSVADAGLADSAIPRMIGLLGRDSLAPGDGLVLTPCNSIHTIGMRFAIDVVFVDSRGRVRKIVRNLSPWRMAISPLSRATIELSAGALAPEALSVGDRLYLAPAPGEVSGGVSASGIQAMLRERRHPAPKPA